MEKKYWKTAPLKLIRAHPNRGTTTIRAHSNRGTTTDVLYAEKENNSRMMGCHSTKHYAQVQCGLIEFD